MNRPLSSAFSGGDARPGALPVERVVGFAVVVALHAALLAGLNAVRIREPVASAPAMVALRIELDREEPLPAAAPVASIPSQIEIRVPPPDVRIETTAPITLSARIATSDVPAPPVVANSDLVADGPVEVSTVEYVRPPEPRYPPASRAAREEGLVVLRVLVDERGRAQEVSVLKSSGHVRLDDAARAAVRRALFKPYFERGVARAAVVTVPIEFAVRSSKSSLAQR
jgi:periplasmic protein TonB